MNCKEISWTKTLFFGKKSKTQLETIYCNKFPHFDASPYQPSHAARAKGFRPLSFLSRWFFSQHKKLKLTTEQKLRSLFLLQVSREHRNFLCCLQTNVLNPGWHQRYKSQKKPSSDEAVFLSISSFHFKRKKKRKKEKKLLKFFKAKHFQNCQNGKSLGRSNSRQFYLL